MIISVLPMLCWFCMFLTFYKKGLSLRSSFLSASLSWGLLVVIATEVLSICHMFNFSWLLITWGVATGGAAFSWYTVSSVAQLEDNMELSFMMKMLLTGVVAIIMLTGLIAAIAAPNNYDSMIYHMSRVMHWIQNQSVAHYPTNLLRQIESNPLAEFAIAHFQILNGGDYISNLIQWFSMVGSVLGVTLIAKQFGANARGQ